MGILQNIREVLKGLKRTGPVSKFCPRCGSSKLRLSSRFDIWLTPEQYICESCGYKGPIVMEVEEEETPEKENDSDTELGKDENCQSGNSSPSRLLRLL